MDGVDDLLDTAVSALTAAEAAVLPTPPGTARYLRAPGVLWRPDAAGLRPEALADPLARGTATPEGEVACALHSPIVRLGKFSRGGSVKVRSYLVVAGQPATLKVWKGFAGDGSPAARERRVRARVDAITGYRSPPVLTDGRVDDVEYLLEPVVYGRHPSSPQERVDAATELGTALLGGYRKTLVGDRRLSAVTHPEFRTRLEAALHDPALPWEPDLGANAGLRRRLLRVVDRDRRLPTATTHGDLVTTNVIRTDDGTHRLVDWEHARTQPVAFDLVKLVLTSGDPTRTLAGLAPAVRPFDGSGVRRYRWADQLALGLAQFLSWSAAGRRTAEEVGRRDRFEAEERLRVRLLADLLS